MSEKDLIDIIVKHKNMDCKYNICKADVDEDKEHNMIINHIIEYNEDEVIITAAIKLDRNDPKCEEILNNMEENQESPIVTILKEIEIENLEAIEHDESCADYFYSNPIAEGETLDDILDRLEKSL